MATNKSKIAVSGFKELQQQLRVFDEKVLKKATRNAVKNAMKPVEVRAKTVVPEDTGALKDSIKLTAGSTDQGFKNRVAWAAVSAGGRGKKGADGKAPGEYVLEMHYGTSKGAKESPFLLNAFVPYAKDIVAHLYRELSVETQEGVKAMASKNKQSKK